jgi:hypothetical protein
MGDEPLNPYLPQNRLARVTGDVLQADIETKDLYEEVIKKFDVYHLAVNGGSSNCYSHYADRINDSYGKYLDNEHFKVSNLDGIAEDIINIVTNAANGTSAVAVNNAEISW